MDFAPGESHGADSAQEAQRAGSRGPSAGWRKATFSVYLLFLPALLVLQCGSGGTGRRASLRSLFPKGSEGSNPFFRTSIKSNDIKHLRRSPRAGRRLSVNLFVKYFVKPEQRKQACFRLPISHTALRTDVFHVWDGSRLHHLVSTCRQSTARC